MLNNCSAIELLPWQQDQETERTMPRPFLPAAAPHPRRPARCPTHPHPSSPPRKLPPSRPQALSGMLQNDSLLSECQSYGGPAQKGGLKRRVELLSEGDICFKSLSRQHLRRAQTRESEQKSDLGFRHTTTCQSIFNQPTGGLSKFTNPLIRQQQEGLVPQKVSFSDFVEQRRFKQRAEKFKEERSLKVIASRYGSIEDKQTVDTSDTVSLMLGENARVEEKREKYQGRMDRKKWKANLKRGLQQKEISIRMQSRENLKIVGLLRVNG